MADQTYIRAFLSCTACEGMPLVLAVRGRERLGEPFEYVVDAFTDDLDVDAAAGAGVYVCISDERGVERHIHGVIDRLELLGSIDAGSARVRFHLRPPQSLLRYRRGARIFQELSVPDIVKKVFKDAGLDDALFRWDIGGSYEKREYCVQYGESEWDFVSRLLEDEGIFYAFEHAADAVVMVFHDASDQLPALEPSALRYVADVDSVTWGDGHVYRWTRARRLVPGKVSLNDYDGLHPSLDLKAQAESDEPHAREHYEYPGGYAIGAEGTRRASVRLEELGSVRRGASAATDLLTLSTARRFELLDHPTTSGEHVIVGLELYFRFEEADRESEHPLAIQAGDQRRRIRFEVVPRDQRFRAPRRTPRPRVHGVQTARVTGPAGEEIHTDEHGRVKVQFHWDLEGQLDDKTTCWIRPTHPHTTGSVTIPRIGWEVLVQFYEGDPDRPVVLGHLYNPLHTPDYALPAQKTVTGHRSNASPGAGSVNEVSFDDAAGSQQVFINAGKDLTINAVNNKTMQTASHYSRGVGANRTFSVGANETISLQANHDGSVGGDHAISIGGNRTIKVSGNAAQDVVKSTTITVGGLEHMQIGNPIAAVLEIIESEAIAAAQGAAAAAADRVQGALLGPVMPALNAVKGALGEAASYAGPATAILGADNPAVALYGDTLASVSAATTPPDLAGMAGGMAAAVAGDAFAALGGGGGGGGGGSGVWGTVVGGEVKETIGALGAIMSPYGVALNVGGANTETIGAARLGLVRGGHSESCAGKTETVGVYFVNASGGFGVEATGAITLNVAASKMTLGKGYAATASGVAAVTAASVTLNASETVTLKCGSAEVIIDKSGIGCKGATSVTIEASGSTKLKPPAIGP